MSPTPLERPIFVVGCPRSGTTLVQCILSASSRAFSLPETHFFSGVLPTLGVSAETVLDPAGVRDVRRALEREAELTLTDDFWTGLAARGGQLSARDVFVAIVDSFRPEATDATLRAIEKTPRHVLCAETIGTVFPDAVFVNVVRDPIDVASSLLSVPFETSRSVLSHAQRWTESVGAAESYTAAHPGRMLTVVYEHLVAEPDAHVRRLADFVDLSFERAMLDEFGREAARNVGRGEAWKRDITPGVLLNRHGVWRKRMTPGQAWLVAQATRGRRRAYGLGAAPSARPDEIALALGREARLRFAEARASTGLVGAVRHAGSVLKTLAAA